ncbi:phage recombination protein Bet [Phenylobacterium sp.]|uniref:phage recombination protein Bet n=1 Tax=Phenylobacterium sp. TaxID=1871053 RepID=UPI0027379075|nr:phage recombination protein Bet [Phenylobacterium sp.]MDP3869137.1 phage recombination protein Bet [Phenylobacterium sp.]
MTTNAVVQLRPGSEYTGAQLALIKRTVAKDTNADEFDLFMSVAKMKGLDPFSKQITAIVFSKDDPAKRQMAIITGIDGMRAIAARSGNYRPDEDEPAYTYDETLKCPANPLGIVKASVRINIRDAQSAGGWRPVAGVAYWEEFAPIKEEVEGGFDWVDTGEVWKDTGKPKKKKVPRVEGAKAIPTLDTGGNWGKMPRIMIAKCAEAQALRKAFPEDLSGLYEKAEFDRAQAIEVTASEIIGAHDEENRLRRIGAANSIMIQMTAASPLEPIPLGQMADRIIGEVKAFDLNQLRFFENTNTHPLREFWARSPTDALEVKKFMEERRDKLMAGAGDDGADGDEPTAA